MFDLNESFFSDTVSAETTGAEVRNHAARGESPLQNRNVMSHAPSEVPSAGY